MVVNRPSRRSVGIRDRVILYPHSLHLGCHQHHFPNPTTHMQIKILSLHVNLRGVLKLLLLVTFTLLKTNNFYI